MSRMFSATDFHVGSLVDAQPLSLLLPRSAREEPMLVASYSSIATAVFLTGEYRFRFFPCEGNTHWAGLIVPSVRLEVDFDSVFSLQDRNPGAGDVVRVGPELTLMGLAESGRHLKSIVVESALPNAAESAGFASWRIVQGEPGHENVMFEFFKET